MEGQPPRNCTQSQLHENARPAFVSARLEFKACFRDLKRDCGLEAWLINVTQQLKRFQSMCCSLADLLSANPAATSKPTETQTSPDVCNQCCDTRGGWGSGWGGGRHRGSVSMQDTNPLKGTMEVARAGLWMLRLCSACGCWHEHQRLGNGGHGEPSGDQAGRGEARTESRTERVLEEERGTKVCSFRWIFHHTGDLIR